MDETALRAELKNFLDAEGRLKQHPARRRFKMLSLCYLAAKFAPGRQYTEKEANDLLRRWHTFSDWCALRRDLYDHRFLDRTADGASYRLSDPQPAPESLGITP